MPRSLLTRRLTAVRAHVPDGCPACQTPPPIVIVQDDEPAPPGACETWGRPYTGITCVRIRRVARGPQ
jgi:hypothetical protein